MKLAEKVSKGIEEATLVGTAQALSFGPEGFKVGSEWLFDMKGPARKPNKFFKAKVLKNDLDANDIEVKWLEDGPKYGVKKGKSQVLDIGARKVKRP